MKLRIFSIILTIFFGISVFAQQDLSLSVFNPQSPKRETRAVWLATIGGIDWPRTKVMTSGKPNKIERSISSQQKELTDILDKLQKANINTVILQTRIRGSVIYPSEIEPWDNCLTGRSNTDPGYDPLAFAIEECHKRGMELHAWVVTIPLGTASRQNSLGSKSVSKTHPSLCKTVGGEMFMIPGNPATADYVASICKEIAQKYDVDGISLDYIRYPEKEYNFSDDALYQPTDKNGKSQTKAEWKRNNISRIVKAVHDAVKPVKPWIKLSSSPLGRYKDLSRFSSRGWNCFETVFQDPQEWLKNDWQDMLFPMMYYQGNLFFPFVYNWKEISNGHPVMPGLGIYFLDPKEGKDWTLQDVRAQMHVSRDSEVGGICLYRSYYLTNNFKGIYDATCQEFFSHPALTARMTWGNDTIAPPSPSKIIRKEGFLAWSKLKMKKEIFYNVYASYSSPVDITRGENLVAARLTSPQFKIEDPHLHYAVTVTDRYGNESKAIQEDKEDSHTSDFALKAIRQHFTYGHLLSENKIKTNNSDNEGITSTSAKVSASSQKSKNTKTEKTSKEPKQTKAKPDKEKIKKTAEESKALAKEKANKEKEKALAAKAKEEAQKEKALAAKAKEEAQKEKALAAKAKEKEKKAEKAKKTRQSDPQVHVVDFSKYLDF